MSVLNYSRMPPKTKSKTPKTPAGGDIGQNLESTTSMEGEEVTITLSVLKQMLSAQESLLKTEFQSMISSVTARVNDLVKTVTEIKTSLEFTQQDVDDAKKMADDLKEAEYEIMAVKENLESQGSKMEYLENQSRRNNIRVNGIPESENENWDQAEEKVKAAIKTKLNIDVEIERVHRVNRRKKWPSQSQDARPRTIVCKLRSWKQREAVLRKARIDKPKGLYICEDLALATLEKRTAQLDKLKEAKRAGKTAYFILDRLVVRDRPRKY